MTDPAQLPPARLPFGVAGGGLLPRFARWAAARPDARALATPALRTPAHHELRWTSRGALLDAVLDRAARLGRYEPVPVIVEPEDPLTAMVTLMAAEAAGRAALLRSPDWDAATTRALAEQFTGHFDRHFDRHIDRHADRHGRTLLILPTSGSSTAPRAVVRTTRSWSAALQPFSALTGLSPDQRAGRPVAVWAPGSPASTLTLWAVWHALATGVPVLATGPWHPRWSGQVQQAVQHAGRPGPHAGYLLQSVPAIADQVLQSVRERRLTAPAGILVAGAATPAGLRAEAAAAGVPIRTYYGAAELSFVAAGPPGALRPFPGVAVQVRGGEIWARSPYTALGYLGGRGGATWLDGWVTVHDRGIRTADGGLLVRGRGDAAATVGGTTVLTSEVEAALDGVPGLAEVVCLPEPDPRLGQRLVAVLRPSRPGSADGVLVARVRELARLRLAPAARPVRYVVRAQVPRTPGGKLARAQLAREIARDTTRAQEAG